MDGSRRQLETYRRAVRLARRGFSLIELLAVIAIIALLLTILMPSLQQAVSLMRRAQCASNLRQDAIAFTSFRAAHDNRTFGDWHPDWYHGNWMTLMEPYYSSEFRVHRCPEATEPGEQATPWGSKSARTPRQTWERVGIELGGLGMNGWVYAPDRGDDDPPAGQFSPRLSDLERASGTPLLADCVWIDGWPLASDEPGDPYLKDWVMSYELQHWQMNRFAIARHGLSVNVAFIDASVRNTPLGGLWELYWHKGYVPNPNVSFE
jgi:prepilin-type N-terminal cleavage/methylation domain-containing protein/prepilin-type processing-associated H-X9-DG protein